MCLQYKYNNSKTKTIIDKIDEKGMNVYKIVMENKKSKEIYPLFY